jgi:hypothetical protein
LEIQHINRYGGMKHSSAKAWEQVKKGFLDSYESLSKAFDKAVKSFEAIVTSWLVYEVWESVSWSVAEFSWPSWLILYSSSSVPAG